MGKEFKIVIKILLFPVFLVVFVFELFSEFFQKCSDWADECIDKLFDLIEEAGYELADDLDKLLLNFKDDCAESLKESQLDVDQTAD